MDPQILQWSQTAEAQPYIQQARQILESQYGGSGYSGYDMSNAFQDPYSQYLFELINQNSQDPSFQKQLMGYYLDYTNPYRDEGAERDRQINAAISAMMSNDEAIKNIGLTLFLDAFPVLTNTNQTGYGGISTFGPNEIPQTYEDIVRQKALKALQDYETLTEDQFNWNKYLATQATPEQIFAYEQSKPTWKDIMQQEDEDVTQWKNLLSGVGTGAAVGAGVGSIVPGLGTLVGAGVGGLGGAIGGTVKTLSQLLKEKEELKRRAAGYTGYNY
jgi:hypothetical protein